MSCANASGALGDPVSNPFSPRALTTDSRLAAWCFGSPVQIPPHNSLASCYPTTGLRFLLVLLTVEAA